MLDEYHRRLKKVNLETDLEDTGVPNAPSRDTVIAACPFLFEDSDGDRLMCSALACADCPHFDDRFGDRSDLRWICSFCDQDQISLGYYTLGTCPACGLEDALLQASVSKRRRP